MNAEWIEHLSLGAGVAVLASIALLFMVYRELALAGGLNRRGRLLLTAGVGLGVLSFATKVAALAIMIALPEMTIQPLSTLHKAERPRQAPGEPRDRPTGPTPYRPHYIWQALPDNAPGRASPAVVALGERLFQDRNLSLDRSLACASCHKVERGAGIDGRRVSTGIDGQTGSRNAPTVWNAAFQARLFWDGRAPSLEAQAKGPPVNPIEMGMHSLDEVAARVAAISDYRPAFDAAYGDDEATVDRIFSAIAAYERTLVAPDSPYDRFVQGDRNALDAAQLRGMALFETVGCVACHHGPNFSAASVFDDRAPYRLFPAFANPYTERYRLTEDTGRLKESRRGLWRVPSLRNVALTAPYFHNGSVDRLEDAVRIMASGQLGYRIVERTEADGPARWSAADHTLRRVTRHELSEGDIRDLAAFLRALSSERLAAACAPDDRSPAGLPYLPSCTNRSARSPASSPAAAPPSTASACTPACAPWTSATSRSRHPA